MKQSSFRYLLGLLGMAVTLATVFGNPSLAAPFSFNSDLLICQEYQEELQEKYNYGESPAQKDLFEEKIKVENYIQHLDSQLEVETSPIRIRRINWLLKQANIRLQNIENEIQQINYVESKKPDPIKELIPPKVKYNDSLFPNHSLGVNAGLFAGMSAFGAEFRWKLTPDTAYRFGAIMANGPDPVQIDRKHTIIFVDGIYYLDTLMENWGFIPPGRMYQTAGLNYGLSVTDDAGDAVTGSIGVQLNFGMEFPMELGLIYGEIGFGGVRTGFSPSYKNLNAAIGFRAGF